MCKDRSNANLCEATAQKAQQQQHYHLQEQQLAVARRCGCGIFPPMSVVPAGDADDSSSPTPASATAGAEDEPEEWPLVGGSSTSCHGDELRHAQRRLPSGDFYAGTWCGNVPHGAGKYLWADGCMYQGEWHRGRATGRGRFSWPSGATYEGDLMSGFMHGVGTYTGSSGDTYRGSRCMNLNHGRGKKCYSNGDFYDGEWRRGVQEGQGRYVWSSGNEYAGSWKAGAIHGKGVLTWANGDCYDGSWEGGAPSGVGRFRWGDGSCYHGVWRKGTCVEEDVSIVPSQNVWGTEAGFLQKEKACRLAKFVYRGSRTWPQWRASVGGRRSKMGSNSSSCSNLSEDGVCGEFEELCRGVPEGSEGKGGGSQLVNWVHRGVKKQGEAIAMGHKSYELMLSLQLGIRHSVEKTAPVTTVDLKASAFDPKEKVWTRFPPEGTKQTPPHQSREFKWKDYCPVVFRTLRKLFKIDAADYMISLCGNDALRELSSPGKSGSFFFLTHDDRYMIKTIRKSEVKVLLRMLPAYYNHVRAFESTLVTKFFGLHCVKFPGPIQRKVRFIIMGNLFCSEYTVHRRFDLKGSSHGRITDKPEVEIDETTTLKDLDLNFIFWLESSWFQEFQRQVDRDCEFLEQERVMDYSLLVGLHFREMSMPRYPLVDKDINNLSSAREAAIPLPGADMDKFLYNLPRQLAIKLGMNMPARVQRTQRSDGDFQPTGEPTGELFDVVLFFGIIDILQDYDISKKLEHAYKSFHCDPTSISAVDPKQYSKRFRDFIFKVFKEDT